VPSKAQINPLVTFYDIHGRNREVLFFYFVPDTTRDDNDLISMPANINVRINNLVLRTFYIKPKITLLKMAPSQNNYCFIPENG
jgi:hypothetical protein